MRAIGRPVLKASSNLTTKKDRGRPLIGVVDFFSGCGGTSLGFHQAGMSIVAGIDNDHDAAATYRRNFVQADFFEESIEAVPSLSIEEAINRVDPQYLLFCGCAPCQPFSRIRRGVSNDSRRSLLDEFGKRVAEFQPHLIFVENVPGLQSLKGGRGPFWRFTKLLTDLDYSWGAEVVSSQEYGVPQRRRRLVLMASLLGDLDFPDPTHGFDAHSKDCSGVWDWIGEYPPLLAGETHRKIPNHQCAHLSDLNLRRIRATPPGGGRGDWPNELVLECHKGSHDGHTDVYGRMHHDRPASALTTRCISLSNGRFGHPYQDRAISVREAAALQTFPTNFVFEGSFISTARQVGNAVPVLLAERFGEAFTEHARRQDG